MASGRNHRYALDPGEAPGNPQRPTLTSGIEIEEGKADWQKNGKVNPWLRDKDDEAMAEKIRSSLSACSESRTSNAFAEPYTNMAHSADLGGRGTYMKIKCKIK